ncbi:AAA family ATPase [Seminavis robusta]|uniref:AAA family ATPase n=1 Tax=Seminavis robusta TaxID=568900 RepID=A0A9N8HYT4_9STRA|nr:AAA family ATPase [Seminavis robusta]|eukprot:Sro2077_g313590.1 AAA family ATPase (862) ;mRNA; f:10575-13319
MPPPPPAALMAALQAKSAGPKKNDELAADLNREAPAPPGAAALMANLQKRQAGQPPKAAAAPPKKKPEQRTCPPGKLFHYDESLESFLMDLNKITPLLTTDAHGNPDTDILVPLAPCVYRMCDYTLAKKEPILMRRTLLKLDVLRALQRECETINRLLWHRLSPTATSHALEEDELGKIRFMELVSNCGVFQKVSELILLRAGQVAAALDTKTTTGNDDNPYKIPQIQVDGLDDFLQEVERLNPMLQQAREEIKESQSVSFYPGLGELFCPGSKVLCFPEGMEGSPLGCSIVQSWYVEELNKATNKMKRRFVLVLEFVISVGDELVVVAASDVYPEFHDPTRNVPLKDLTHRKLDVSNREDSVLLQRLQQRGEFYASVATHNHYLEYYPNSFFPIIGGGWSNNAVRPLSKGGRVMVDVKRGILEGHMPVRGTSDGMSDTVKEAIKLFEQSKRTGVAVPFRTCVLPGFHANDMSKKKKLQMGELEEQGDSDRPLLWQSWPMLTGFSFTARVWGKLLLGMPKPPAAAALKDSSVHEHGAGRMVKRPSMRKMGVELGGLGGEGSCGNCGYIKFQEQAFDQLVLAEDKKELIRAVARNAGGSAGRWDEEAELNEFDDGDDDGEDDVELDVVANKGGASIFLLQGPAGVGKTLTAEAIAELLKKPLYIVTAGDLGITAAEVEKTLGSVLELCQTWDALVLLDEADVFLEVRSSTEIQRNALVCVMLRLLEYYSGCLFLSSNRPASAIDPAIASRITVMLQYPPLDADGRSKVWKNLVELVPAQPVDPETGSVPDRIAKVPRRASKYRMDFSDEDYKALSTGYTLNGRQIKNSIVLARALARERGSPLSMEVLKRAVTAVAGENAEA